jgi:hypothetical protein
MLDALAEESLSAAAIAQVGDRSEEAGGQYIHMAIDDAPEQRSVVAEGRSNDARSLPFLVPNPDLDGFLVERVLAERGNLLRTHGSAL